jgi:hypothetical protein
VTEPSRYIFRFGWLTVTAEDLAVWEQFSNAAFTLVTTAAATDVVGEEFSARSSSEKFSAQRPPSGGRYLAVPELTRGGDIKLNARVLLRRLVVAISFADEARTPFQCCLNGRLGRGGGGLALVPARLCRMDFQALTVCPE